ncbi:MAG: hypothetical protein MUQ27_12625, partial [Acidimicrobiia bacterium]|nr:hypothetical protein [Acidimicrobiia bacterium]
MSDQDARDRTPRGARPGLAAALSALIPGAGQWYVGRPVRAAVVASPLILLIIASFLAWQGGAVGILEWLVRPEVLWMLLAVNVLLLAWRLFAVVDAFRLSGDTRPDRWSFVLLGVAVVIIVVPHLVAGAYGFRGALLIDRVFVSADQAGATPATLAPPSPEADLVPDPVTLETTTTVPPTTTTTEDLPLKNAIFRPGFGDPDAIKAHSEIVFGRSPPPFLPFDERVNPGRLTFLLAGGDAGPGRGGLRTDTIMVATVDLDTGQAALFGIPRNLGQIPMPKRFEGAFADLEQRLAPASDPLTWTDVDGDGVPDAPAFVPCNCFPEQ